MATEPGYWYSNPEIRRLINELRGDSAELAHAWRSLDEQVEDAVRHAETTSGSIVTLDGLISAERNSADAAIQTASKRSRNFGFGFFAGAGVVPGGFEPVVGAGFVWRIW